MDKLGHLNASQKEAVSASLRHRVTIVQGPPGTGKTSTSVETLRLWAKVFNAKFPATLCCSPYFEANMSTPPTSKQKCLFVRHTISSFSRWGLLASLLQCLCLEQMGISPILATSDTNVAVDNIAEGLVRSGVKVVRVGRAEKVICVKAMTLAFFNTPARLACQISSPSLTRIAALCTLHQGPII